MINNVQYIESEKIWRAPEYKVESSSLGKVLIDKLRQTDPEKVLEIHYETGLSFTAGETLQKTITIAQNLMNLGIKKDDRIVFFSMVNSKIIPLSYACFTIGAPVCFFDVHLAHEYIPRYMETINPSVIMYEENFKSMVVEGLKNLNLPNLRHFLSLDGDQPSVDRLLFKPTVDIDNFIIPDIGDPGTIPAVLSFTSSTTGLPKIVMNSHNLIKYCALFYDNWKPDPNSVLLILSEPRWVCQQMVMIQPTLYGCTRIFSSTEFKNLTPEFVKKIIDTKKVTHYIEVPRFMRSVLEAGEYSKDPSSLSSLKCLIIGGESVEEGFQKYISKLLPNCTVIKSYGMTEMAGLIATSQEFSNGKNSNGGILKMGAIVKILDSNGKSVGPNEIGQVHLKIFEPFLGYLGNDQANRESFLEGGWFNTGDLGLMDSDNLLNIFMREKFSLKYPNGKYLIPTSIETIVNNFDDVDSSALIENPKHSCGTIFVLLRNKNLDLIYFEDNFRKYLKKKLTKEQLEVVKYFKVVDDFPITACFKLNRMQLKEIVDGGVKI